MRVVFVGALCLVLGGCSFALDESSGVFAAAPGKYDYLDCKGLAQRTQIARAREAELSGLMERAGREAMGNVVNTLVYRDELNAVRADQYAMQKAADEKRCAPDLVKPTSTSLVPLGPIN